MSTKRLIMIGCTASMVGAALTLLLYVRIDTKTQHFLGERKDFPEAERQAGTVGPVEVAVVSPEVSSTRPERSIVGSQSAVTDSSGETSELSGAREERLRSELGGSEVDTPGPADVMAQALALQPNREELRNMSTSEVVQELAFSPHQVSLYHLSDYGPDRQLSGFAASHLGVGELLERPDAATALLDAYRTYSDAIADPDSSYVEPGSTGLEFAALEMLLAAQPVLDQLAADGRLPELMESVLLGVERQSAYDAAQPEPVYGQATLPHAATVAGRCLERLADPVFLEWLAAPGREGILTERKPTHAEATTILEMAGTSSIREVWRGEHTGAP